MPQIISICKTEKKKEFIIDVWIEQWTESQMTIHSKDEKVFLPTHCDAFSIDLTVLYPRNGTCSFLSEISSFLFLVRISSFFFLLKFRMCVLFSLFFIIIIAATLLSEIHNGNGRFGLRVFLKYLFFSISILRTSVTNCVYIFFSFFFFVFCFSSDSVVFFYVFVIFVVVVVYFIHK